MSQLALPLKLQDHAVFETFWPAGNEALVAYLEALDGTARGPGCWLWGRAATGKSHLLQAVCERLGDRAVFLPLTDLAAVGPAVLEGVAERPLVCLDDLQRVTGDAGWERALFELFNDAAESGTMLIIAALAPSRESRIALPDLASRCAMLPAFHLRPLAEHDRRQALIVRAKYRGLDLPDETARFLTTRSRRDMASLYTLLDRLDGEALVAQRRLTIPFVKSVIERR